MSETSAGHIQGRPAPRHIWVIGSLALVWNASGAFTIMMAQAGKLSSISPAEAAYYAAQPFWFVAVTDIALLAAVAAAAALLLRSRTAVWMFALSLIAIFVTNIYDLVEETSRMLASGGAVIMTGIIVVIAILELVYAWAMKKRKILR